MPREALDFLSEIRVLLLEIVLVLFELVDRLLEPLLFATVSRGVLAGVVDGSAKGIVVGAKDVDLALELWNDDVAEVVGFGLSCREARLQGTDLANQALVGLIETALPLHEAVPFLTGDLKSVVLVAVMVMVMPMGAGALDGYKLLLARWGGFKVPTSGHSRDVGDLWERDRLALLVTHLDGGTGVASTL